MNKKKPLWRRLLWPAVVLVALGAWLLASNSIIMALLPASQRIEKVTFEQLPGSSPTYGGVDSINYSGGLTETLSVSGWCFTETDGDNAEKRTQVALVKDGQVYLTAHAERSYRGDIYRKLQASRRIQGPNHGYAATFATFPLPAGRYDIYLYNWENEADYGLYKTGYAVEKNGSSLRQAEPGLVEPFPGAQPSDAIDFRVDSLTAGDSGYTLSGWGLLLGVDSNNLQLYAELTAGDGRVITSELATYSRPGIASGFNDGVYNYLNSGYTATLPASELPPGRYTLRLLALAEGAAYRSTMSVMYEISEDGSANAVETGDPQYWNALTEPVDASILNTAQPTDAISLDLRHFVQAEDQLRMAGSVSLNTGSGSIDALYLALEGENGTQLYQGDVYLRDGLREELANPTALEYVARVPIHENPGTLVWQFYAESGGQLYLLPNAAYTWSPGGNPVEKDKPTYADLDGDETPDQAQSTSVQINPPALESGSQAGQPPEASAQASAPSATSEGDAE